MSEKKKLDTDEAAKYLGVKPSTLAGWRRSENRNQGPPYFQLIGKVYYLEEDLDAWVASCRVEG